MSVIKDEFNVYASLQTKQLRGVGGELLKVQAETERVEYQRMTWGEEKNKIITSVKIRSLWILDNNRR